MEGPLHPCIHEPVEEGNGVQCAPHPALRDLLFCGKIWHQGRCGSRCHREVAAMVAYVGTQSDCSHDLAIALSDAGVSSGTLANSSASSNSPTVTGGTWRLPSVQDWQYMFIGCGEDNTHSDSPSAVGCHELTSKPRASGAGTLPDNVSYWTNTKNGLTNLYCQTISDEGSTATFASVSMISQNLLRAVLAF